jgi:hypothetical protein
MPVAGFGPLVLESDLDETIIAHLRLWLPVYLTRFEEERGLALHTMRRPRLNSYQAGLDNDAFPNAALPAIIVTTNTLNDPDQDGDGVYYGSFTTTISAIVRGRTPSEALRNASIYAGCIRRLLPQQVQGFAEPITAVDLTGGNRGEVTDVTGENRHLAAGMSEFRIYVDEIVAEATGPFPDPDVSPDPDEHYDPPFTVDTFEIAVEGVPVPEEPGG